MTILTATFANSEETAVLLQTSEAGSVMLDLTQEKDNSNGWRDVYQAWTGVTSPYVIPAGPTSLQLAKAHVGSHFDSLELLTLKDWKDSIPAEATPRLQASYAWVQTVIGTAAAGGTSFTLPPYTFTEVLAEISTI
jgi:hypothetical protein